MFLAGSSQWEAAKPGLYLGIGDKLRTERGSQATVRFADLSVLRINELTTFELMPPQQKDRKPLFDLKSGSLYFFSREKPADVQFRTPNASGAIRGTEFHVQVSSTGDTALALLDGEIELGNEAGRIIMHGGEEAAVRGHQAPTKTALLDAVNVIQWCLYYPGVIDSDELSLSAAEQAALTDSLIAYRAGDLPQALAAVPANPGQASEGGSTYLAALQLGAGQVERANQLLRETPPSSRLAQALREIVAAVQFRPWLRTNAPVLASEWMAHSYYWQSRGHLEQALQAARAAAGQSPSFGFAWARIAELEFCFGRLPRAEAALAKALLLSPRNAQGLALKGFLAAARDRTGEALGWFDRAIDQDGALANAWLGRALCRIRLGEHEAGRRDLQVAAALEPHRAMFRSYLAKAYNLTGRDALAAKELRLAKELDPKDPTAWLYSALLNQQQNQINEAIRDLERSQALNDNQAVFRSRLLLDQDQAVRAANLAAIYSDAGLQEVGFREAAKAVNYDYLNYSAHLFLANSYEYLQDRKFYNLRYAPAGRSEWLVANLLAPVGAGTLSRNVSQQDYTRLFERDRLGLSSSTEYFSNGEWVQSASQYGTFGKVGYAVDAFYHTDRGQRPNNDLDQLQLSTEVKAQLAPQDSLWVQVEYFKQETGDIIQYFDQRSFNPTLRVTETQEPNLWAGYHHEWTPSLHTLFLAGRLDDTLEQSTSDNERPFVKFGRGPANGITSLLPRWFEVAYDRQFEAYSAELQQIWQTHAHAVFLGAKYQAGWVDTVSKLTQLSPGPGLTFAPIETSSDTTMDRVSFYGYHQWQIGEPLRLTTGLSYDRLRFPQNVDTVPVSQEEESTDLWAPKVGLVYTPWKNTTLRGAYTRSLGGFMQENSYRLEPTQIAGFTQTFRSLIPESAAGLTPAATFETGAVGIDQVLPTGTYLGVEGEWLNSDGDRWLGAVSSTRPFTEPDLPFTLRQTLDFEERTLLLTANQLLAREWSIGARYRLSDADLHGRFPDVPATAANFSGYELHQAEEATLHQLNLFLTFNHRSGVFSQVQSVWNAQSNRGYQPALPGEAFWQEHLYVGYRFPKRVAEVRLGILNLTGQDYRLNPLNLYLELPRQRTLAVAVKINY